MANRWSDRSIVRLSSCDHRLQLVFSEALEYIDMTVICGHRNEQDQRLAYESGNSKVNWPNSKHNKRISAAIDVVPYPSMWDDYKRFYYLHGIIKTIATKNGIKLRWGGNWDMDEDFTDNKFMDLGHWELVI